jgi:hypothetical protein
VRLRTQPLVMQHQLPLRAGGEHALRMRVPAAARIALGGDQHVLAERS